MFRSEAGTPRGSDARERRTSPRHVFAASLKLATTNSHVEAFSTNVSVSGVRAVSPVPIPVGERVALEMRSAELWPPMVGNADVVWSRPGRVFEQPGTTHFLGLRFAPSTRQEGTRLDVLASASEWRKKQALVDLSDLGLDDLEVLKDLAGIAGTELSSALSALVERFDAVGDRSAAIWPWVFRGLELTTLPCVDDRWRDDVLEAKFIGAMLDTLIDDVADRDGDDELLEQLLSVFGSSGHAGDGPPVVTFAYDLWQQIEASVSGLPHYAALRPLLLFDYRQLCNAMRYSLLVNQNPSMFNAVEHDAYLPHNMHMMVSATMDLMASPQFEQHELGALRELVWHAQMMGRLGNMLATWQREVCEGDFSSGVFAWAFSRGILAPTQLQLPASELLHIIQASNLEKDIVHEWICRREAIAAMRPRFRSLDVDRVLAGLDGLLRLTVSCWGLI